MTNKCEYHDGDGKPVGYSFPPCACPTEPKRCDCRGCEAGERCICGKRYCVDSHQAKPEYKENGDICLRPSDCRNHPVPEKKGGCYGNCRYFMTGEHIALCKVSRSPEEKERWCECKECYSSGGICKDCGLKERYSTPPEKKEKCTTGCNPKMPYCPDYVRPSPVQEKECECRLCEESRKLKKCPHYHTTGRGPYDHKCFACGLSFSTEKEKECECQCHITAKNNLTHNSGHCPCKFPPPPDTWEEELNWLWKTTDHTEIRLKVIDFIAAKKKEWEASAWEEGRKTGHRCAEIDLKDESANQTPEIKEAVKEIREEARASARKETLEEIKGKIKDKIEELKENSRKMHRAITPKMRLAFSEGNMNRIETLAKSTSRADKKISWGIKELQDLLSNLTPPTE